MVPNSRSLILRLWFAIEPRARASRAAGFLPIGLIYLALAFYQIDGQSLWTDEVISINRVSPGTSIWTRVYSQSPLYFVVLDLWTQWLGTSEFALRSLSALLGLGATGLVYLIGVRLFSYQTGALAALLFATSPFLIWYAQEVRYITLLLLTSLGMTYSFHRAISEGGRKWWFAYGASSALAFFSFMTVVFLALAHGLYLLFNASHRALLRRWIICLVLGAAIFGGWFVAQYGHKLGAVIAKAPAVVSHEQRRSRQHLPLTDLLGTLPYTGFVFSVGFSLGPSLKDLHESRSAEELLSHAATLVPVGMLFASFFVLGLLRLREDRSRGIFLVLWLAVPVIGAFAVATLTTYHVYNIRYVAMAMPAYLFILAAGIGGIRKPAWQRAAVISLLLINGLALANYYFDPRYGREDARSAARYLEAAAEANDIILVVGHPRPLRYYYQGASRVVTIDARGRNGHLVAHHIREYADRHERLWLVEVRAHQRDPKAKVRTALDMLARRGEHKGFSGVDIFAYDPKEGRRLPFAAGEP